MSWPKTSIYGGSRPLSPLRSFDTMSGETPDVPMVALIHRLRNCWVHVSLGCRISGLKHQVFKSCFMANNLPYASKSGHPGEHQGNYMKPIYQREYSIIYIYIISYHIYIIQLLLLYNYNIYIYLVYILLLYIYILNYSLYIIIIYIY
jgi:hypothetical protein